MLTTYTTEYDNDNDINEDNECDDLPEIECWQLDGMDLSEPLHVEI